MSSSLKRLWGLLSPSRKRAGIKPPSITAEQRAQFAANANRTARQRETNRLAEITGINERIANRIERQEEEAAKISKKEMNAQQDAREGLAAAVEVLVGAKEEYARIPKNDYDARRAFYPKLDAAQRKYEKAVNAFTLAHGAPPEHYTRYGPSRRQLVTEGGTRKRKNRRRTLK
jgi:hypothetical protein